MIDDIVVNAEPGADAPAVDTAGADIDTTPLDDDVADVVDPPAVEKDDADLDLEAEAARLQAEKLAADKAEEEGADKPDPDAEKVDQIVELAKPPRTIAEATERIGTLEARNTQLTEMETKILEIGGMPLIEMVQPVIDVLSNTEAKFGDILTTIADATGRDPQDMAYELLESEENQAAALAHFCGEDITPDILTQLVDGFQSGKIKLEDAEGEEADDAADDVFLSPKELKDRERMREVDRKEKATTARDRASAAAEKTATATRLEGERTAAHASIGTLLDTAVNTAIAAFKADPADTPEVKDLKEIHSLAVYAITTLELSRDPTFQRVQGLIKANGFKAADALTKGALSIKVSNRAAAIAKRLNPGFSGAVVKLQKAAAKIATVRTEPSGARGAGDIGTKRDTSVKNPNWRAELEAETQAKIDDLGKKQKRSTAGTFA